jgi:hypothetical protein
MEKFGIFLVDYYWPLHLNDGVLRANTAFVVLMRRDDSHAERRGTKRKTALSSLWNGLRAQYDQFNADRVL